MDCKNRKGTLLLLSYTRIEGGGGEEGSFYSGAVGGWTTHIKMTLRIDTYHHNESRHTAVAQKQVKTRFLLSITGCKKVVNDCTKRTDF